LFVVDPQNQETRRKEKKYSGKNGDGVDEGSRPGGNMDESETTVSPNDFRASTAALIMRWPSCISLKVFSQIVDAVSLIESRIVSRVEASKTKIQMILS
jgi:hypothetical protein